MCVIGLSFGIKSPTLDDSNNNDDDGDCYCYYELIIIIYHHSAFCILFSCLIRDEQVRQI